MKKIDKESNIRLNFIRMPAATYISALLIVSIIIAGALLVYESAIKQTNKGVKESFCASKIFTSVIEALDSIESVCYLKLDAKSLTEVPEEIRRFKHLKSLELRSNNIALLPAWIGTLTILEDLYLNDNAITAIPDEIGELKHLKYLDLANNYITTLPSSIVNLSSEAKINLLGNQIAEAQEKRIRYWHANSAFSPVQKTEQKDCPQGFYSFENNDFSLCYPHTMTIEDPNVIENVDGTKTNQISITANKRYINILPRFFTGEGQSSCIEKSEVTVSGLHAIQERNHTISQASEKCGPLSMVTTIVEKKDGGYFYIYEGTTDNSSIDLNEYNIIESSLRIK